VVGFSLSFLNRWAAAPGAWLVGDLVAVATIIIGIALQIVSLASLLSVRSLLLRNYVRSVRVFLAGLAAVCAGVAFAIGADIFGYGQRVLG
jgi:hypothetical protein